MKKTHILWFILMSLFLCSCGHNIFSSNQQTNDLIAEDTIVTMIAEQLIYESTLDFVKQEIERKDTTLCVQVKKMVGNSPFTKDSLQIGSYLVLSKLSSDFYGPWLKKRGYTYEQYENSLIYYFKTEESTKKILTQVKSYISQNYGDYIPEQSIRPPRHH